MKLYSLLASFEKLAWARTKIVDLNSDIRTFFDSCGYEIFSEVDSKAGQEIWKFGLSVPLPSKLAIETGVIINNLRAPLDQMVCALGAKVTGSEASFAFPFGNDRSEFERHLKRQLILGLPKEAGDLIREARPYRRGNFLLWSLNHFDRRNKHRPRLVATDVRAEKRMSYLSVWFGQVLIIGNRAGQHLVVPGRLSAVEYLHSALGPSGTYGTISINHRTGRPLGLPTFSGRVLTNTGGFGTQVHGFEFLTTTPGTKVDTDFQPTFNVAIGDLGRLRSKPVVSVLNEMANLVEGILLTFERRFFS